MPTPTRASIKERDEQIAFVLANPDMMHRDLAAHFGCSEKAITVRVSRWRKAGLIPQDFRKHRGRMMLPGQEKKERKKAKPVPAPKPQEMRARGPLEGRHNPKQMHIHNRDAGKVLVRVDARTWKYVTPETANA